MEPWPGDCSIALGYVHDVSTALNLLPQQKPKLVDAPSEDRATSGLEEAELALVSRFGGILFTVGATVVAALAIAPHPDSMNVAGMLVTACAAYGAGFTLLALHDRPPLWAHQLGMAWGTICITLAIHFYGADSASIALFYLMVAFAAFYFLSRAQAIAQLLLIGACYGFVLLSDKSFGEAIGPWTITLGVIAALSILMGEVRQRSQSLLSRLAEIARTDPLTGLLNRRGFEETFRLEVERAERAQQDLCLLIADLDHLKEFNDSMGHPAGDAALQRVGALMFGTKRRIDSAARFGGDEFALVLPYTDESSALVLAERIRKVVDQAFAQENVAITISFGIASFPQHGRNCPEVLRSGEQALYTAKALGRDRTVVYGPEIAGTIAAVLHSGQGSETNLATLLALAETLDYRDSGTAKHSHTVGGYTEDIARELGLPAVKIERIRTAGILHDIGKVGIPDAVLQKPSKLNDEEWEVIKKHPEIGARILNHSGMDDIREWVLDHQERVDGKGYPRGLEGDEIPLEARILAVADAYEAMTSDRVYRKAMPGMQAKQELIDNAGTQFDERVIWALLAVLDRGDHQEDKSVLAAA